MVSAASHHLLAARAKGGEIAKYSQPDEIFHESTSPPKFKEFSRRNTFPLAKGYQEEVLP
jgi:hypothetical protein